MALSGPGLVEIILNGAKGLFESGVSSPRLRHCHQETAVLEWPRSQS